ncbi:MAG TPA: serine/threonine protein kinase [Candidatus Bathyarchaeia archaeon]
MKQPKIVALEKLDEEPYASIVCYPRTNPTEIYHRLEEMQQHGVTSIEFVGKTNASNIPVLGKGYVGVVVVANVKGQKVALKMRRIDADRLDFTHEAEMLQKANAIGVGPKFIAVSNNFLLSQLIDGDLLEDWLQTPREKGLIRKVLVDILEQCWILDEAGLDHGELSKAPKHLLVDKMDKPFIVDFETASIMRKVINVTSVCQFLFMGNSRAAKMLDEVFGKKNRLSLISGLKKFKKNTNRKNFEDLLDMCLS